MRGPPQSMLAGLMLFLAGCSVVSSFGGLAGSAADGGALDGGADQRVDAGVGVDSGPLSDGGLDPLSVGLAGYWSFDEASGMTARDGSGNANDGTLVGGVTRVAGKVGGALRFDGATGRVHIASNPTLITTSTMSISLWVQFEGATLMTSPRLISRSSAWDVKMNGAHPQLSSDGSGYAISSASLTNGAFHHLGFVFDHGKATFYVDGAMTTIDTDMFKPGDVLNGDPNDLILGAYASMPPTSYLTGILDEVRLYSRLLTADEMAKLAQ